MRTLFCTIFIFCLAACFAQGTEADSLKRLLDKTDDQQTQVRLYESLSYAYLSSYPDTAMYYALKGLQLAKDISWLKGEAICTDAIGSVYFHIGDNAKALELYLHYLQLKEKLKDYSSISVAYYNIASVYTEEKDYRNALSYLFRAVDIDRKNKDSSAYLYDLYSLGSVYARMKVNDSALHNISEAYRLVRQLDDENMTGAVLNIYGDIWLSLQKTDTAASYYRKSMPYAEAIKDNEVMSASEFGLAKVFQEKNRTDSTLYYAVKAYQTAYEGPFFKQALEVSQFISNVYKDRRKFDSAFHYQQLSIDIRDSLFNAANLTKVQNMKLDEQQRQQGIVAREIKYQNNIRLFIVISVAIILLVATISFWQNYRAKKTANRKLQDTLAELKATQAQLIQSEKMASLGELTAGIAHEIQNPLNFVNNFSELNNELIADMNNETDVEEIKAIATDIKHNNEKISRHGKRAGAIVKSMLQHSKRSEGKKEPTNINALCDEYLRLSYHGTRAKDKDFHAELKTDFDERIQNISIVPQNLGRALLNLFNNSFYAVNEKKKEGIENYHPLVTVETKQERDKLEITVSDNGTGIPIEFLGKVFQPFFTTKPTGEGIGLGLSLAYDIIIKEHNGTIKAESKEGEGSRFIITLPNV